MADPITIIGSVGALANIIGVVTKSVQSILDLKDRWKEADLTLLSLASQLGVLKTALIQIREWMNNDLEGDPYHQLVMDLDVSVQCCELLVAKIDMLLGELGNKIDEPLDFASIVKLVFQEKNIDDVQKMLGQQISALNLLLNACNCKTLSEQKVLLETSKSRKLLGRAQLDSASLFVHRDSASFASRFTDNLSKLSMIFDFDSKLFSSKIYEQALRGSVKEALRRQQGDRRSTDLKRSQAIDRRIEEDSRRIRRECRVLVLGNENSGKSEILKMMKIINLNGYGITELESYRETIYRNAVQSARELVTALEAFDVLAAEDPNREFCDYLSTFSLRSDADFFGTRFEEAIRALWKEPYIGRLLEHQNEFYMMDSAPYFFEQIKRIASPDYIPVEADVLRAREPSKSSIKDTMLTRGALTIKFTEVIESSHFMKYIHCFENVTSIMFVVNLADYDQTILEPNLQNRMMESLVLFESLVNSRWFMRTSIILLLNNAIKFKEKLPRSPLGYYFPDYAGGNNSDRAMKYILWRFNRVNRAGLKLYPHITNSTDTSTVALVFNAVKESILQNALQDVIKD